jgi:hypothetical protein
MVVSTTPPSALPAGVQVTADRVNPMKFYAASRNRLYASADGGATFVQATATAFGRPRSVFGVEGDVWVAAGTGVFRSTDSGMTYAAVPQVSAATAVGFGKAMSGGYPAVYVAGSVGGVWGIFRSDDAGMTWTPIDDPQHQFGFINILAGDQRQFGRVYLGTGGRGIVYGDPQ